MNELYSFIERRSRGEKALLMTLSAIAIFAAGFEAGEALAYLTGAA
jgi:hypothetical protein